MFFPKAMSEIELIVPAKDLLNVTRILGGRGVFHQVDGTYGTPPQSSSAETGWQEKASAYAALERRIQVTLQNLGIDGTPLEAVPFEDVVDLAPAQDMLDRIERDVKGVTDETAEATRNLERLKDHRQQLQSVADIDLNVGRLRQTKYLFPMLGVIPASNLGRLQTSLARIPHVILTLREDAHRPIVWLAGTQSNHDIMERAARSAYFEALSLPLDYDGTPREVVAWLDAEISKAEARLQSLRGKVHDLARKHSKELLDLAWGVHASRTITDAIVRFGRLRHTYVIVGWIATEDLPDLTGRIKAVSKETLMEASPAGRAGDRRHVPVKLQSSRWLKPFQLLVTTYARPRYGEVDPTWLIALTFPILFGAMFGDVGHGLLLAALGALLSTRRVKMLSSLASLGGLITVCGLVAAAFGFLYGSIFGFEHVLHAAWLQPGEDPLTILTVAIGAGVVLLSVGFLIGIFNGVVSRDWGHLLFGHGGISPAVLYWSLLGFAASSFGLLPVAPRIFAILAMVTGLAVMFSGVLIRLVEGERPLIEGGIGTYAIQAPMELFEAVISFLSNSLSYVRIGAFAIAHVVLSSVVFLLAELISPAHGIGYWVIVVIGNVGIVFYEGLIVGIQAMRLSYYELFSKFFTGGGMRFEPLALLPSKEA
ncbi:MAG TPA: V-type ATPase 116kDa subunit family protein [Anaerolineales bacterium]